MKNYRVNCRSRKQGYSVDQYDGDTFICQVAFFFKTRADAELKCAELNAEVANDQASQNRE